ncbi:hypothetical protein [Alicyclobacillus acidoterrestris]|uniref:Uncharacterized protein n=1 Tax=Alicyclobacillus acidoterrestris (strain ATCC 49025 / DSM 3922 / CIP 106132 / NCIMB 13137 / GD3B) TaxID=1356854 RepID=T0D234_ALIAG|nr:hypothetical protein [Alicyclobacillus acidoterrestris]EPZ43826.1 hypothetical protein N007_11960 [Alicyclobacillus acidoterrestris ATCC 49025]UNO49042.1 hypothetical protein K1I37_00245 [Alicyclobacillus acidoterrestris]
MTEQDLIAHIAHTHHHVNLLSKIVQELIPKQPRFHEEIFQPSSVGAAVKVINIPFMARFACFFNPNDAGLFISEGQLGTQPPGAKPISAGKNISMQIQQTQILTLFQPDAISSPSPVIIQFSDRPIPLYMG